MTADPEAPQTWITVYTVGIPVLGGVILELFRLLWRFMYIRAIRDLGKTDPQRAMAQLERLAPPSTGFGSGAVVLLLLGGSLALQATGSVPASVSISAPHGRCRPSCTGQQRCIGNVCTDTARPAEQPAETETAAVTPAREPSSINLHSTLLHMDPQDLWLSRRREDEQ